MGSKNRDHLGTKYGFKDLNLSCPNLDILGSRNLETTASGSLTQETWGLKQRDKSLKGGRAAYFGKGMSQNQMSLVVPINRSEKDL